MNRRGVFLSGLEVCERPDGGGLRLWGQERRALLPDGKVVHSKAVAPRPSAFVVVRSRAREAGSESETDVNVLTGPRRKVEQPEVVFGEVVPAVNGTRGKGPLLNEGFCVVAIPELVCALFVKAAPDGCAGVTGTLNGCQTGACNEVPAGFLAVNLDDGEVVHDVGDDEEAGCGRLTEGAESEMSEEFDAHERTICTRQVNVVENHAVVPVLAVAAPFNARGVGFHVAGPHEIGRVEIVGRGIRPVVASGRSGRVVGLQVPVGRTVDVFLEGPRTAGSAT